MFIVYFGFPYIIMLLPDGPIEGTLKKKEHFKNVSGFEPVGNWEMVSQ